MRPRQTTRQSPTATSKSARDCPRKALSVWSRPRCNSMGTPATTARAPQFNEHGDEILAGLGLSWDEIVDLKVSGAIG